MSDKEAMSALGDAFAGNDDASAGWSQTAPDIKSRCIAYVAAADGAALRVRRARDIARLAAAGPIHEGGAGEPGAPDFLRHGFGGVWHSPAG